MTIRIIIADDHSVVRQGLRMFLGLDPELEVVGEAVNGAEAVARAEARRPDGWLFYTSPSPRDRTRYPMPSSACKKKNPIMSAIQSTRLHA